MATVIRAEISEKSKYWISKHRHYELKHFCLQYPTWKKEYAACRAGLLSAPIEKLPSTHIPGNPTERVALKRAYYQDRIDLIEKIAMEADRYLYKYILKAVTEELSYTYLRSKMDIPCGRDMYYDRYRKFFWLLSEARQ